MIDPIAILGLLFLAYGAFRLVAYAMRRPQVLRLHRPPGAPSGHWIRRDNVSIELPPRPTKKE